MSDCVCPYCEKEIDDPDDCWETNECYEHECPHCGKNFIFRVEYIRTYYEEKADCLNGGEHNYQSTHTYPPEFAKTECTMCHRDIKGG